MSRIGRMPVEIPEGVQIEIEDHNVTATGPRGQITKTLHPDITIRKEGNFLVVSRPSDERAHRALHGLTRALVANMVEGVSKGFRKELEIQGVGYRAEMQGEKLVLMVGYSHPVVITPPQGIKLNVEKGAKNIAVEGADKELVGKLATEIRAVRKPEPYKGKGIRYAGEYVRHKAGKAGKIGGA